MNDIDLKKQLQTIFSEVLEDKQVADTTLTKYFSPNYTQCVNGETLNYSQFLTHMKTLKASMLEMRVEIKRLFLEGNNVISIHHVYGTTMDQREIEVKVFAHFVFQDGKIISCDEITHLLKGTHSDKDLGSRQ